MSRVIKAGQARLINADGSRKNEADEALHPDEPAKAEGSVSRHDQAESLRIAVQEARRAQEEEFRAAYDELIAAAQDEAAMRMEDARQEAQSLINEAKAQSDQIRQEAFEAGVLEGRIQAETDSVSLLERAQAEAAGILEEAAQERLRIIDEVQPKMYRLALDVAEKILKYELNANDEAYMGILGNAINHVRTNGPVTLHVNAAEFTRVFGEQDQTKLRSDEGMIHAAVTVDPSVEPGGCLIETDSGAVDASVSVQIEQIAQSLGLSSEQYSGST